MRHRQQLAVAGRANVNQRSSCRLCAAFVDTFRQFYGPTMKAFASAAEQGRADELRDELVQLFRSHNQCQYPGTTLISANFLKVTVDVG